MKCSVGVDIGTTNVKALALDFDTQQIIAHTSAPVLTLSAQPEYAEQEPEAVWQLVKQVLAELVTETSVQSATIESVTFSTAMHSLLAVDAEGQPLTNALLWSDNRAEQQALTLHTQAAELGRDIYQHTGTPIHPMIPLCKLAWFRENEAELLQNVARWLSLKEYIWWKLTGNYQIDYSIATATGLFDEALKTWYAPALNFAGVRPEQLSELKPTTWCVPYEKGQRADACALPEQTKLYLGASDGCLANLGAGAIEPGITTITIGTSGAIRRTVNQPLRDEMGRLFCYYLDERQEQTYYVVGGPTNNGANVLQWLAEHLTDQATDAVLAEAESVPPGADGLLFLPYLQGERAPLWDAHVRGAYLNVDWQHTRAHFVRAALEGVLFNLLSIEKILAGPCGPTQVIHANGGFAKSRFWVQMLADIFGVPVRLNASNESSAIGAVLLTEHGDESLVEAAQQVAFGETFTPDATRHEVYRERFQQFEAGVMRIR